MMGIGVFSFFSDSTARGARRGKDCVFSFFEGLPKWEIDRRREPQDSFPHIHSFTAMRGSVHY